MSADNELPSAMTVADFLVWETWDSDRWELIDGVPRAMAAAFPRHSFIQAEGAALIGNHLADLLPGCRVAIEPGVQPKLHARANVRVPDLAVTCAAIKPGERLLRDPLLVVEILSPSNRTETWGNVWTYATIWSVRDILVLHTDEVRADLLRREGEGAWPNNPVTLWSGDLVVLPSIALTIPLEAFYRTA